jgi:acetylornithine deacetylase/succinyl-diaminopimelate desuccinylase-like protein
MRTPGLFSCTLALFSLTTIACSNPAPAATPAPAPSSSTSSPARQPEPALPPDPNADAAVKRVMDDASVAKALTILDRDHEKMVADVVTLTEIPAPPFKEDKRGAAYLSLLRGAGLTNVERDAEGNVMGLRKGTGGGPLVAVAAHLDTVFPEGTDVRVKRDGTRLAAPGVGDNTRSLAVLLAIIRAMNAAGVQTSSDILFVGNVGEEGAGDLRGVKHLFMKGPYKDRIKTFISIDGTGGGESITNGGVGSKRYRATFKGPGGHSYGAFGLVNPAFAMGQAMALFSKVTVPASPKTTFNVGVVGGGTSVNSIPFEVWMDVDMRSESPDELTKLDETFKRLMQQAVDEENAARSKARGSVTVELKLIGDRPSGQTPVTSPLVATAASAIRAAGLTPKTSYSSTDSNIPISLGIPAITIDSGGSGGEAHAPAEWIDVEKAASLRGMQIALVLLVSIAR